MSSAVNRATTACALAMVLSATTGTICARRALAMQDAPAQNPDAKILADFDARVKQYAALHEKLERTLTPLPDETTPELIGQHQRGLELLLARARAGARRSDIFTDPIRAYFRRQLSRVFNGPEGGSIRLSIMDEDTRAVRLAINGRYPDGVPRSAMPPQVLLALPRLPEQLEYRFVGRRLVLLDVHALTVVDFMDNAVPR